MNPVAAALTGCDLQTISLYCDTVRASGMSDEVLCRLLDDMGSVYRRALLAAPSTTRKYRRFLEDR